MEYTQDRAVRTGRAISEAFSERGRPYAVVVSGAEMDRGEGTARIRFTVVDPGPPVRFGPTRIHTDSPVDESVVRDRLAFHEGEDFRPSLLDRTRRQLDALPVVQSATVAASGLEEGDTVVTTEIQINAVAEPRGPEVRGSISSVRCLELMGGWRDRYFLSRPNVLTLRAGVGNLLGSQIGGNFPCGGVGEGEVARVNYFAEGDVAIPWPGRPLGTLSGGAWLRRQSQAGAYVVEGAGGRLRTERPLGDDGVVWAAYELERIRVRAAGFYYCLNFGACGPEEVARLEMAQRLAPLEVGLRWAPGLGFLRQVPGELDPEDPGALARWSEDWRLWAQARVRGAGGATGSQIPFRQGAVTLGATREVGLRGEGAVRLHAGILSPRRDPLPPQLRFFSGGMQSVRGSGDYRLGPQVYPVPEERLAELDCVPVTEGCADGKHLEIRERDVRPRGGDLLVEWNLEGRLQVTRNLQVAAFVDVGFMRTSPEPVPEPAESSHWEALAAPGFGIRVFTPAGLLRLDAALDPRGDREVLLVSGDDDLVPMGRGTWNPYTRGDPGTWREIFRRIHFGLALGQPF